MLIIVLYVLFYSLCKLFFKVPMRASPFLIKKHQKIKAGLFGGHYCFAS